MKKDINNFNVNPKENKKEKDITQGRNNLSYIEDFQVERYTITQDISFVNMVFDPGYRNEVYAKFDEIYIETDEERDIFESMQKRR